MWSWEDFVSLDCGESGLSFWLTLCKLVIVIPCYHPCLLGEWTVGPHQAGSQSVLGDHMTSLGSPWLLKVTSLFSMDYPLIGSNKIIFILWLFILNACFSLANLNMFYGVTWHQKMFLICRSKIIKYWVLSLYRHKFKLNIPAYSSRIDVESRYFATIWT